MALVLSCRPRERVEIGPDVWIDVIKVSGQRAFLAISAPEDIRIVRVPLDDLRFKPEEGDRHVA